MPKIKPAKIWKKKFDKKGLEHIWEMFDRLNGTVDWDNMEYADFFRTNTQIPYPETDEDDDTEGVQPNQIFKLLNVLGEKETYFVFNYLKNLNRIFRNNGVYFEDGYISWKKILKNEILTEIEDNSKTSKINVMKKLIDLTRSNNTLLKDFDFYKYEDKIYLALIEETLTFNDFNMILSKRPFAQGKELELDDLTMKNYWDKRKELWKKIHGIVPQVQELLLLEPEFWHKDVFLESLQNQFGEKQLSKLDAEKQANFINIYKMFGPHIRFLNSFIKEKKILLNGKFSTNIELYNKMSEPNNAFLKIISESKKGIALNLSIDDYKQYLTTLTYFKEANDDILKKDRITIVDLNNLKEGYNLAISMISAGKENMLKNMSYKQMAILNKYGLSENQKKWALDLYNRTCHLQTEVPLFKGTVGDYEFEMIDKNDIRGLVAGNATNCCQTLQSSSRSSSVSGPNCVYAGQEEKTQTFFLISKKDRIIAQSWVWLSKNKEQLTFDNIEVLGQELRDSLTECYNMYAEHVLSLKDCPIKHVTVGSGNSDIKLGDYWKNYPKFETIPEAYDARNTQYLIASKKESKKSKN